MRINAIAGLSPCGAHSVGYRREHRASRRSYNPAITREAKLWLPKLSLAANILLLFLSSTALGQQNRHETATGSKIVSAKPPSSWKQYSYPEAGFEITVPHPPRVSPDAQLPGATAYLLLPPASMALHVKKGHDCSEALTTYREIVSSGRESQEIPGSFADIAEQGHPGFDYERAVSSNNVAFERWFCANDRLYVFAIQEPASHSMPASAKRILNSFRLITPSEH